MTRNRPEIVETRQIIPADKWYAVYKGDESGEYLRDRIAVWALLKRKNEEEIDHVEGMVSVEGFLEPCEDISNFIDYCHADDIDRLYPESIKKDSPEECADDDWEKCAQKAQQRGWKQGDNEE